MKMQSLGNLIAVASCKPNFASGEIEPQLGALGRIAVGEIIETMTVRLFEFHSGTGELGNGGRIGSEIAGIAEASAWQPWAVQFENGRLSVRRSTTWRDEHCQQWEIRDGTGAVVVWVEFETRTPGEWRTRIQGDDFAQWVSAAGDVVALATDGRMGPIVAGANRGEIREKLERGESGSSLITCKDHWYRGVIAWIRHGPAKGTFALAVSRSEIETHRRIAQILAGPEAVEREAKRGWGAFFANDVPPCPSGNALGSENAHALWRDAWFVLRGNRMDYARPPLAKPFGSPSKFNYHHQWLWDSGFHSIAWRWANDKHWAQEETANLFDNQLEQGRICHEIYCSAWRRQSDWPSGQGCFAPTSQPPVLAMAAEKIFERTADREWLEGIYPRLMPYLDWWSTVRDPDGDGLAGWANGYESGLDDSPRWDHITRSGNAYFPAPLEATELNALLVNEWRSIARIAGLLGYEADIQRAQQKAARIKSAMRSRLWDDAEGFFYCLDHEERPIRIKTIGGLLGLLALEAGDREIGPLVQHLTNEREFWTPYPVPSVAVCEKAFSRGQMWRGPTWINTNWLLIRALERLGQGEVAEELKKRTLTMVVAEGSPKLWEWYDPISGRALGNMEYGWSALVIDLMMD
jgi:hypothetical protein